MTPLPLHLNPVGGPETPARTLDGTGSYIVGRARESDLCLAGTTVSRRHAMIMKHDASWVLTDLKSRHGTFLNGLRLEAECATELATGDLLRFGPFTFRVLLGSATAQREVTIDLAIAPGMEVRRATEGQLEAIAARRLQLLVDGAESIYQAQTEDALGEAIVDLAVEGTGLLRGAFIRFSGDHEHPEVVATRTGPNDGDRPFAFSHSLLLEATAGEVVHLAVSDRPAIAHSINLLGIHSAVCAPLMVDGAAVGAVYLDARESERPASTEAMGYCHALARLASLALASLRRTDLRARQARLEEDIQLARQAQAFLGAAEGGELGHLRYAMESHPGRFIAGDLFDIFPVGDQLVGFCIGDVSGQGLRAGILMTAILAHIRASMVATTDPAIAMAHLNQYVSARTESGMFATIVLGIFDCDAGEMRYVDAGHGHWFIRRAGAAATPAPRPGSPLVGVDPEFPFVTETTPIAAGDRIILYSDGVVEHRGATGDEFGTTRLRESIAEATGPEQDVRCGFAALHRFIGDVALADDTTLASIEVCAE